MDTKQNNTSISYNVKDILEFKGYDCHTVDPETTVYNALKKMAGQNVGALVVAENGKTIGVFSERDYARKVILKGKTSKDSNVKEMMSEKLCTVSLTTNANECMKLMTDNRVRHLPVLDNNKLVGVISIGDIVNAVIRDQQAKIQQLEDYITGKR